jgi:hypothetical protein
VQNIQNPIISISISLPNSPRMLKKGACYIRQRLLIYSNIRRTRTKAKDIPELSLNIRRREEYLEQKT